MDLTMTKAVLALYEAGERFALVSTLETQGSSPRHSGAAMLVKADGSIVGTVGGGALEARAISSGLEVLETGRSRVMGYELTNADSAGLGMICGGQGMLLIEHVDPAGDAGKELWRTLLDLLSAGATGWLVTGVSDPGETGVIVRRCLVDSRGAVTGDEVCPVSTLQALAHMGGALDGLTAGDRPGVYVQPVGVPGAAYVFGAGHCGKSLVPLLGMVGFRTVIIDDRAEFASPERFPDADEIVVPPSFESAFEGLPIDQHSYVVIMTRGHLFDRAVLAQALRTRAGYVGMIGSKKKIAETYRALLETGFTEQDLRRVHAPIGVDIGAETPEEIAVSITAEIVRVRRARPR
jgi:xanthine dehydrogenase accessory factor